MSMLHSKIQPLKHISIRPKWHIETVKLPRFCCFMIVNTYLHVYYYFIELIVKTVNLYNIIHTLS